MARTTPKGKDKVQKVMREYKQGKLKSGSGRKVRNPKQAIAIGLNEQRRKEGSGRRSAAKRPAGRKTRTRTKAA